MTLFSDMFVEIGAETIGRHHGRSYAQDLIDA